MSLRVLGFGVSGFKVLWFGVYGFRVFRVYGLEITVLGFQGLGVLYPVNPNNPKPQTLIQP